MNIIKATYVSVWDGGVTVETPCDYDMETGDVENITVVDVDGLDICEREYVLLPDGTEIDCEGGSPL